MRSLLARHGLCGAAFCLIVLTVGTGVTALAQDVSLLHHRVRVTTAADSAQQETRYAGLVTALANDTLTLVRKGVVRAVPLPAVRRLEVSRGRRGYARTGALIGAGLGVVAGLAAVGADDGQGSTGAGIVVVPLGAALYGGVGALIGTFVRRERWEVVPLDPFRVP